MLALEPDRPQSTVFRTLRLNGVLCIAVTGIVYHLVLAATDELHGLGGGREFPAPHGPPCSACWGGCCSGRAGRPTRRIVAWSIVYPLLWLAFTLIRGEATGFYPYPFVDVDEHGYGRVLLNCLLVALLFLALAAGATFLDRRLAGRQPSKGRPVLVTSRSYAEYEAMFDLKDLPGSVLDCCAGGAVSPPKPQPVASTRSPPIRRTSSRTPNWSTPSGAACRRRPGSSTSTRGASSGTGTGSPERKDRPRIEAADAFLQDVRPRPSGMSRRACRSCRSGIGASSWCCARTCCSRGPTSTTGLASGGAAGADPGEPLRGADLPAGHAGCGEPVPYLQDMLQAARGVAGRSARCPTSSRPAPTRCWSSLADV